MIKFTKLAFATAALVIAPTAFAGQTMQASGTAGTGVDFVGGITPVSSNPGVAAPGATTPGAVVVFGDFGVMRGIFTLADPVTFQVTGENSAGATLQ